MRHPSRLCLCRSCWMRSYTFSVISVDGMLGKGAVVSWRGIQMDADASICCGVYCLGRGLACYLRHTPCEIRCQLHGCLQRAEDEKIT